MSATEIRPSRGLPQGVDVQEAKQFGLHRCIRWSWNAGEEADSLETGVEIDKATQSRKERNEGAGKDF